MLTKELISILESWAPKSYQESYDNSGLLVGSYDKEIQKALITLDCTEEVIDEAIASHCDIVIAHHPIIFSGLKRLNGSNYVERTVLKAIQNNISIYAIHTNLDNVHNGVNQMIAQKLNLINTQILLPKQDILKKLITFIPNDAFDSVAKAVFDAGAGTIGNYSQTGFSVEGTGTFMGNENSNPAVGTPQELERVQEKRFETIFPSYLESNVIKALLLAHPYEEVAYDILSLDNSFSQVGSGYVGELKEEISLVGLLNILKETFHLSALKYTEYEGKIKKIALCGGSGSFLRKAAFQSGAQAFITADFKYHEYFDAEKKMSYIDVGHYESEQFTKELIFQYLEKNALSLQSQISRVNTNPVKNYF